MTDTSRETVERLLDGVTPGPWAAVGEDQGSAWGIAWSVCRAESLIDCPAETVALEADARFIAAARDLVPALLARAEAAEARLHEFQAAQGYRYIGRDMKPVLARDLEDRAEAAEAERDALKAAQIDAIRSALEVAASVAASWYHNSDNGTPQDEIRALDPAAIAASMKGEK